MESEEMQGYNSFLGTGWSFPPTFSKAGKGVVMSSDEQDIEESLKILLSTAVGERLMEPKYGCQLTEYLFDPVNTTLSTYIKGLVERAILHFEPRITCDKIDLEKDNMEGTILITINYTIRATNSRYNFVYPYYSQQAESE